MAVKIVEVETPGQLNSFIAFPFSLYRGSPYWVPPLNLDEVNTLRKDRNPAFEHCEAKYWLAYDGDRAVGRIAGILNWRHIEKWGQRYLRFGWFDFVDDPAVSTALLAAVEAWGRELGMEGVHGPLGFSDLDREGMLVEGFEEPGTLATQYNPPYYPQHMEGLGYTKDTDWVEYEISVPLEPNEFIAKMAETVLRRSRFRLVVPRNRREVKAYVPQIFELLDEEYEHLYGTVPLSSRQVEAYTKQYFDFVVPGLVPIVLDEQGRLAAFGVALPSLTQALQKAGGRLLPFGIVHLLRALKSNDRGDLYLVAVRSMYQGRGVNAVIIDSMSREFNRLGIRRVESNPELETNLAVRDQWKYFEHRQHKRRRCYFKLLEPESSVDNTG